MDVSRATLSGNEYRWIPHDRGRNVVVQVWEDDAQGRQMGCSLIYEDGLVGISLGHFEGHWEDPDLSNNPQLYIVPVESDQEVECVVTIMG